MKIGVDLDDVLAETMSVLADFHNEKYGTDLKKHEIKEYGFNTWGGSQEVALGRFKEFFASEVMEQIKPVEGAVEGVKELSKNNSLIVITNRPPYIESLTRKWIERFFGKSICEVYFASHWLGANNLKKSDVCLDLAIDILIDDAPHNVLECAEKGIKILLFDAPWNQMVEENKKIKRVKDWQDIINEFEITK